MDRGDGRAGNVVFSLEDGFVWASWSGTEHMVRLGRHDEVTAMMRDFLAQNAVGERLWERATLRSKS
jgi:hypothetical protein